eukprot:6479327-Prymnesium_polylepis.1
MAKSSSSWSAVSSGPASSRGHAIVNSRRCSWMSTGNHPRPTSANMVWPPVVESAAPATRSCWVGAAPRR